MLGSVLLGVPAASADDGRYRAHDDRYRRHGYGHRYGGHDHGWHYRHGPYGYDRHHRYDRDRFTLGVRVVDHDVHDRGRRGVSRGDRWWLEFNLVDYRQQVGHGFADCRVTKAPNRKWRDSKSRCDLLFRLPDGELRMAGSFDGDDFDDGHATFPIRGGSGEFRGADGKTVFRPTSGWYAHGRGRGRDLVAEVHLR